MSFVQMVVQEPKTVMVERCDTCGAIRPPDGVSAACPEWIEVDRRVVGPEDEIAPRLRLKHFCRLACLVTWATPHA